MIACTSPRSLHAQEDNWIVEYSIRELRTNQLVFEKNFEDGTEISNAPIMAGAEYNTTMTFDVALEVPNAVATVKTDMEASSLVDRYWEKYSDDTPLVDYNPAEKNINFRLEKGSFVLSHYGKIPSELTVESLNSVLQLHKPSEFSAIEVLGPDGSGLDGISLSVIDDEIDEYRNLLKGKEEELQSLEEKGVAPGYVDIYETMLNYARNRAEEGFVQSAMNILNRLGGEGAPIVTRSIGETLFLPVTSVLGVLAVVLLVLMMRSRGKAENLEMIIEDQIREIEGLKIRAGRVDKSLESELDEISERLKNYRGL